MSALPPKADLARALSAGQCDAHCCIGWQRCAPGFMPSRCSVIFAGLHIEGHQVPAFYTECFQWHRNRPSEPTPPSAITDDKLDLSGGSLHDLLHMAERLRVKIEQWHSDEVADSCRLRKAPQIALLHRHRILASIMPVRGIMAWASTAGRPPVGSGTAAFAPAVKLVATSTNPSAASGVLLAHHLRRQFIQSLRMRRRFLAIISNTQQRVRLHEFANFQPRHPDGLWR